jgi:hypothetical protein
MEMIKSLGSRYMCRLKKMKGDGIWSGMWDSGYICVDMIVANIE